MDYPAVSNKQPTVEKQIATEEALASIIPDDSDEVIAQIVANYLLMSRRPPFVLSIFHDVRPSSIRRVEKWKQIRPDYEPANPVGPCPVPVDWHYKNLVGITTRDYARAEHWIIEAMLLGYGVFRGRSRHGTAGGQGSLTQIRTRLRNSRKPTSGGTWGDLGGPYRP
jgi:hypothetical protein